MRRHRYEDYYAQAEIKLQRAELGPDDVPIFAQNALESLDKFQAQIVSHAKQRTLWDTLEARQNKRKILLGDVLRDSRSGGSAKRLQECLQANRDLRISVDQDPNLMAF